MHVFAMFVFFSLGVMAVSMFGESLLNIAQELRAVVLVAIGIGLAWAVDFNVWSLWHLHARAPWVAVTLTGAFLGGGAYFWHAILGFFSGLLRKFHDQAAALEKTEHLQGLESAGISRLSLRRTHSAAG
jgi:hypothetical protein